MSPQDKYDPAAAEGSRNPHQLHPAHPGSPERPEILHRL